MAQIVNVEYFALCCNKLLGTNYTWDSKQAINIEWLVSMTQKVYTSIHQPQNGCRLLLSNSFDDNINKQAVDTELANKVITYLTFFNRLCDTNCECPCGSIATCSTNCGNCTQCCNACDCNCGNPMECDCDNNNENCDCSACDCNYTCINGHCYYTCNCTNTPNYCNSQCECNCECCVDCDCWSEWSEWHNHGDTWSNATCWDESSSYTCWSNECWSNGWSDSWSNWSEYS